MWQILVKLYNIKINENLLSALGEFLFPLVQKYPSWLWSLYTHTRLGFPLSLVTASNAYAGSICNNNTAIVLRSGDRRHFAAGYHNISWQGCFRTISTTWSVYWPHVTGFVVPVLQWYTFRVGSSLGNRVGVHLIHRERWSLTVLNRRNFCNCRYYNKFNYFAKRVMVRNK